MDFILIIFLIIYTISSILLLPYPLNYIYLAIKSRNWNDPLISSYYSDDDLPQVAIQIPVFNEPKVIESILKSVLNIDYPTEKLHIMILDDSTDSTSSIISKFISNISSNNLKIDHIQRIDRIGYKAGALNEAITKTNSELITIFDADFNIPSDFLRKTVHHFKSRNKLSAIQTRWIHSNEKFSLFTRTMSLAIDGHFLIEKPGRYKSNGFISFNGTAGIWRKSSIISSGGWSHNTLAEDIDLAYRTQFQGQNILYLQDITVKQEITPTLRNWAIQQTRWSQGFSQNFRSKFLTILTKGHNKSKFQGIIQLSAYYLPLLLLINLISGVFLLFIPNTDLFIIKLLGSVLGIVSFCGLFVYAVAINRAGRSKFDILLIPLFLFWGSSLIIRISFGAVKGFFRNSGEFIRTPKFNLNNEKTKNSLIKTKIPLDAIIIVEILVFVILSIGFVKSLEIGLSMVFTSLFYGFIVLSIFFLLISNITHSLTKNNLK